MRKKQPPTKGAKGDAKRGVDTSMIVRAKDFDKPVVQLKKGGYKMKPGLVYLGFSTDFLIEEADQWRGACWSMIKERSDCSFLFLTQKVWYKSPLNTDKGQCHQLKTGAFVLCEKTAKQMQLVGAGLCSARQDTPNYRKSSANPYALTRVAVEADAHIGPAECTDFTGIFGEFTAAPYIQRGNCLRIRRKFSKEFTAFCRAEQSPAPTNCGCISTVFA